MELLKGLLTNKLPSFQLSERNVRSILYFDRPGFLRSTQSYLDTKLHGYQKNQWGMWNKVKNSGFYKYLWETSGSVIFCVGAKQY